MVSSGIVSYFGTETTYFLVEPDGAASLSAAMSAAKPMKLEKIDNFADGASVAKIGSRNFAKLKMVDPKNIITIPENRICTTMLDMLNIEGIVLEPAGALSIDSLKDVSNSIRDKEVICITTRQFDFERLPKLRSELSNIRA